MFIFDDVGLRWFNVLTDCVEKLRRREDGSSSDDKVIEPNTYVCFNCLIVSLRFFKPKPRFTVPTDANRNRVLYNSNYGFRLLC